MLIFNANLLLVGLTFEIPIKTEKWLAHRIIIHKKWIINVEFLVPFLCYNFTIWQQVETVLTGPTTKGVTPTAFCNTTAYIIKTYVFNVDWLYTKNLGEKVEAKIEVVKLRYETPKTV